MGTKRIFISDIHLGRGEPTDWFKDSHKSLLLGALKHVSDNSNDMKDLVLLGDVFDTWVMPIDKSPPTVSEIAAYHRDIIEAISQCAGKIANVFYLNGNHDMSVSQADLDTVFGAGKVKKIVKYQAGLLYAEHGNRFAMFNAPDPEADPIDCLPLGYFISRLVAGHEDYASPRAVLGYIDNLLSSILTPETLPEAVIDALMERYNHKPTDTIKMPGKRADVTLATVRSRYATLFSRWIQRYGLFYALDAVRSELNSLGWAADRLCKENGYRVVVLGHTHDATEDLDQFLLKKSRLYVNSGYFCTNDPTLVEVDKQDDGLVVRLLGVTEQGWVPRKDPVTLSK